MKNIYIILILTLLVSHYAKSDWEKVTNMPSEFLNSYWLDVYFLESDPNFGWACGYSGKVIRTTDGGKSWKGVVINGTNQLESIHFPSKLVGYTSGEGYIFRTTDGGTTWRNVSPVDPEIMIWGTYFPTDNIGFVVGGNCFGVQKWYRTDNGGASWQVYEQFYSGTKLADVMVRLGTGIGYASSSGLIWKSTDAGVSWRVHSRTGALDWHEEITNFGKSFLVPYSTGCDGNLTGLGGVRFSVDDGKSWRDVVTPASMYGSFLIDSLRGWVCGLNELVYYTSDGGITWKIDNCGLDAGANLDDIWFINDTTGWLAGQGLYRYAIFNELNPKITALGPLDLCEGDSVVLRLEGSYKDIRWSTGETTQSIVVKTSGSYRVFVSNSRCEDGLSAPIDVVFHEAPKAEFVVEPSGLLCKGDTVQLKITTLAGTYRWLDDLSSNNKIVTESGTYRAEIENEFGCKDTTEISLVFNPLPSAQILPITRTNVCIGDSVILKVSPDMPNVLWQSETNKNIGSGNYLNIKTDGLYYAQITDANGCTAFTDSIQVSFRYETNKLRILIDTNKREFFVDSTRYPELSCRELLIENTSDSLITINNPFILYNLSFSIPKSQLPLVLPAKSTIGLNVCYSPRDLKFERDTLIIEDICSDYWIPVVAFGEPNLYSDNTRCDAEVEMKSIKLSMGTNFITTSPYPNPASKTAVVSFALLSKTSETPLIEADLIDILGNNRLNGAIEFTNMEQTENGIYYQGTITFDLNELTSGLYFIQTKFDRFNNLHKLAVE